MLYVQHRVLCVVDAIDLHLLLKRNRAVSNQEPNCV